ncbi:MAG: methionine aminotransferase [Flavobacteriales bacterium]
MPEFKGNLSSKMPRSGLSIFAIMSKMAREKNAINLSQGFPDFKSSSALINRVHEYMKKDYNQYAPMPGVPNLREAISEKTESLYNISYEPENEVTVTSGATQAIYTAITATVKEDDEVVIFTPAYDCYQPAVELNNGKPIFVQLKPPDYTINWSQVKKVVNRKTKMIIINTPHNPTGSIINKEDMKELEKLTKNSDILILSDEVYEHIIFDGEEHQSVCKFPGLAERSFIVLSFGKTFHNTGWKMGYCLAPGNLMKEIRKVHQYVVFGSNTPIQYALADHLNENKEDYLGLPEFYQEKRDFFCNALKNSNFKFEPTPGTYFQLLKYDNISKEADTDFAKRLIEEKGLASVPISVFYQRGQ